jgi:YD repeat-containing protein
MTWLEPSRVKVAVVSLVVGVLVAGGSTRADFVIGEPVFIEGPINSPGTHNTQGHSLLHDGLKLYYTANHGGIGSGMWVSERESTDAPWGEPVYLLHAWGLCPAISPDELELYFYQKIDNVFHSMRSIRASMDEDWGPPTEFNELGYDAWGLDFSPDGLTVYFDSMRSGGYGGTDIWMATRETISSPWDELVNLGENVNSPEDQTNASISNDGLVLFFDSNGRIKMCARSSTNDDWGPAIDLDFDDTFPVLYGSRCTYYQPDISPDGSTLYLESHRSNSLGNRESFWQVSIKPFVDLNRDGIVDAEDLLILVDHWDTDEPLCDIGPMPWGDGVVDALDLTVLGEHLFEETGLFGSFTEDPIGVYTMTDRSADVWGSADQFHFGYKTLTGPGTIVARIESVTNTHLWAKAGVMIRETLDAGSKHAFVFVTPGKGVHFQGRSDTGGEMTGYAQQTGVTAPHWVRLEWDGQGNFTAAHSPDGSTWQSVGGTASMGISMNSNVHIGLALCSHNTAEVCEGVFTDVTITGTPNLEWANTDIGFRFRRP